MKNRKKVQEEEMEEFVSQSPTNPKVERFDKELKERVRFEITKSDIKLEKTKKQIIKEAAITLEELKYPVDQICQHLTEVLDGLVHDRTVRGALDAKYKNPEQMATALQQTSVVGKKARLHARVLQKQILEITKEDIQILPLRKAREVATYYMSKVDWWLQLIR